MNLGYAKKKEKKLRKVFKILLPFNARSSLLQIVSTPKELLEISPLELRFSLEINKWMPCIVKLTNKTDDYVAFYFGLMMAKKNYYIEPTSGFLWPRSTFNVVVTMEEQQELQLDWQCSDEFLIQSIAVEKYMLTSKPITADLFDNMSSNLVNKVKLTVVYVPPASSFELNFQLFYLGF